MPSPTRLLLISEKNRIMSRNRMHLKLKLWRWLLIGTTIVGPRAVNAIPMVRVGYVVPTNRSQQPGAVDNLRDLIRNVQDWYGQQLSRYGFGNKTFEIETEAD